jgi:hypothetical protein
MSYDLDIDNLAKSLNEALDKMNEDKKRLRDIVDPFWADLDEKKRGELCDVAKLICRMGGELVRPMESPDFLILHAGVEVGVEVRELVTTQVEYNRYIQRLFSDACTEFKSREPDAKLMVTFYLEPSFVYSFKDKKSLVSEIAFFVQNYESVEKPWFVTRFDVQPHSQVDFYFNEGAYFQEVITRDVMLDAISEKEAKVPIYIENSGTEKQWLLLVTREGSDSFDTYDTDGIGELETAFEHIYLLKDFDMHVIQLK